MFLADIFSAYRLPGGHSERVPPDPIPNSEVKTLSADDSVGSPHAKVGHCQVFLNINLAAICEIYFFFKYFSYIFILFNKLLYRV